MAASVYSYPSAEALHDTVLKILMHPTCAFGSEAGRCHTYKIVDGKEITTFEFASEIKKAFAGKKNISASEVATNLKSAITSLGVSDFPADTKALIIDKLKELGEKYAVAKEL